MVIFTKPTKETEMAGRRWVIFSVATIEDMYGVARVNVPNVMRNEGDDPLRPIHAQSADDIFRLYWEYTNPKRMSYTSSITRKLQGGGTHGQKLLGEMTQRHCTTVLTQRGKPIPTWMEEDVFSSFEPLLINHFKLMPSKSLPPGIDPDVHTFLELAAWRMMYAYLQKFPWPASQQDLKVWSKPGTGKDTNNRQVSEQREKRKVGSARLPTKEELDSVMQGEISADELFATGARFEKTGRRAIIDAQENANFNQRGRWATHMWINDKWVKRP